jgi:hypothetical protein
LDVADSWRDFELIAGNLEVIAGVFGVADCFGAVADGFGVVEEAVGVFFAVLAVGCLLFEARSSGESRSGGGSGGS